MNYDILAQELIPYADGLGAALAADTSELFAKKIVETARYVTGIYGNEQAVSAIKADATAQERFRKAAAFLLAIEKRAKAPEISIMSVVGEKDLLQAKTAFGVMLPAIAMLANHYGFDLGDQQSLVDVLSLLAGAVLVLWGRITAVKRITSIAGVKINA